jgi:N-acyl-D-aspartate/D-glutamate deacylase
VSVLRTTAAWIALTLCVAGARAQDLEPPADAAPVVYDLVIANGRVLDPESGVDGVRHLGIQDGRIAEVSEQELEGREVLDATGLAVAPGFVDVHVHGQNPLSYDFMARDGVTSALDLELGAHGVKGFLRTREGESRIHYGVAAGHIPARIKLMHGVSGGHPLTRAEGFSGAVFRGLRRMWNPTGYQLEPADEKQIRTLVRLLGEQLDEGGIGIGMILANTPGATPAEVRAVFELAAQRGVPVFVHVPEQQSPHDLTPLTTVIDTARATGASLHVVHIASSMRAATPQALAAIDAARAQGLLVTTEVYPYTAGSTLIELPMFAGDWRTRSGLDYGDLQWVATGERLTEESFARYRKQGGMVVIHGMQEAWVEAALRHPDVLVASDGMPMEKGGEHPRGAGTHARVLGVYVRERGVLTLMDAIARMSWLPARRLEWCTPAMAHKGRIRAGADADLVVFDPATVIDRATYEDSHQASDGIPYVLVSGSFVVREGALVQGALPGKPLRSRVGLLRSQEQN